MIKCEIIKKDADRTYFKTTVEGNAYDTLTELIGINCEFVTVLRKLNVPEEMIEKQLVNCVLCGFEMSDHTKEN